MKRQKTGIALKPSPLRTQNACEKATTRQIFFETASQQQKYVSTRIDREIEETSDGSRLVKETETSTTNSQSQSLQRALLQQQEIKSFIEILNTGKPPQL